MKLQSILEELLSIASLLNYTVRREKGNFRSGDCRMKQDNYIVLNSLVPLESRISVLAKVISMHNLELLTIKPAVRLIIEQEKIGSPKKQLYRLILKKAKKFNS